MTHHGILVQIILTPGPKPGLADHVQSIKGLYLDENGEPRQGELDPELSTHELIALFLRLAANGAQTCDLWQGNRPKVSIVAPNGVPPNRLKDVE